MAFGLGPGLVSDLAGVGFGAVSLATFFVAGVAAGVGLVGAELFDLNNPPNNFFGDAEGDGVALAAASDAFLRVRCAAAGETDGDAAGDGLASVVASLRERRSGVAEAEGIAEAAGLASVAPLFLVRFAVAEGKALVSAGLAVAVASVFFLLRCFAGDSAGEGLGLSLCAKAAVAKAIVQRTTRDFKVMAQSSGAPGEASMHFHECESRFEIRGNDSQSRFNELRRGVLRSARHVL